MKRVLVVSALMFLIGGGPALVSRAGAAQAPSFTYRCLGSDGVVYLNVQNLESTTAKVVQTVYASDGTPYGPYTFTIAPHGFTLYQPGAIAIRLQSRSKLLVNMVENKDTSNARQGHCT